MKPLFLKSVQTMRFFAALGVVQYHLWQNYFGVTIAHPGTDFFLVLIGVVAAYTHAQQVPDGNWWKYISERYRRLYVTFIPLFVITLLAKLDEANIDWVVKSFFFIPMPDRLPVIGSTWMISLFLLFYFLFSICFLVRTEKILWVLFAIWIVAIVSYNFYGWDPDLPEEWSDLFFAARNAEFIIGYLAGIALRHGWLHSMYARVSLWVGLIGVIAGTVLLNLGMDPVWRVPIVGLPIALFVLGLSALELQKAEDGIVKLLTTPWLVWIGGTSYVLYLSHGIFFRVWSRFLPVAPTWFLPMTLGAILAAALGYLFWEKPILTYLKSRKGLKKDRSSMQVQAG